MSLMDMEKLDRSIDEVFRKCKRVVDKRYPKSSKDARVQAAATMSAHLWGNLWGAHIRKIWHEANQGKAEALVDRVLDKIGGK